MTASVAAAIAAAKTELAEFDRARLDWIRGGSRPDFAALADRLGDELRRIANYLEATELAQTADLERASRWTFVCEYCGHAVSNHRMGCAVCACTVAGPASTGTQRPAGELAGAYALSAAEAGLALEAIAVAIDHTRDTGRADQLEALAIRIRGGK